MFYIVVENLQFLGLTIGIIDVVFFPVCLGAGLFDAYVQVRVTQ